MTVPKARRHSDPSPPCPLKRPWLRAGRGQSGADRNSQAEKCVCVWGGGGPGQDSQCRGVGVEPAELCAYYFVCLHRVSPSPPQFQGPWANVFITFSSPIRQTGRHIAAMEFLLVPRRSHVVLGLGPGREREHGRAGTLVSYPHL